MTSAKSRVFFVVGAATIALGLIGTPLAFADSAGASASSNASDRVSATASAGKYSASAENDSISKAKEYALRSSSSSADTTSQAASAGADSQSDSEDSESQSDSISRAKELARQSSSERADEAELDASAQESVEAIDSDIETIREGFVQLGEDLKTSYENGTLDRVAKIYGQRILGDIMPVVMESAGSAAEALSELTSSDALLSGIATDLGGIDASDLQGALGSIDFSSSDIEDAVSGMTSDMGSLEDVLQAAGIDESDLESALQEAGVDLSDLEGLADGLSSLDESDLEEALANSGIEICDIRDALASEGISEEDIDRILGYLFPTVLFRTIDDGFISYDVGMDWNGKASFSSDGSYCVLSNCYRIFKAISVPTSSDDALSIDDIIASMEKGSDDLGQYSFSENGTRKIGDATVTDYDLVIPDNGETDIKGILTIVNGKGFASILVGIYPADDELSAEAFDHVRDSIALSEGTAGVSGIVFDEAM